MRKPIAALSLSALAFVGILVHEGYRGDAYIDPVGIPTIGFGTTEGVKIGDRTTVERSLVRALDDADKIGKAIARCITVPLYEYEWSAYVAFAYNVGPTAFCRSTLVRKLNAGDYAGACAELSRWTKAGGRELPGLVKRRSQERAMCEGR